MLLFSLIESNKDAFHTPVKEVRSKATAKLKSTRTKAGKGMHWLFLATVLVVLNIIISY